MTTDKHEQLPSPAVNRRTFLKVSGALAAAAAAEPVFRAGETGPGTAQAATVTGENLADAVESAENILYSVCQMCHGRCGIRAKVVDGILVKIDGNPWHPNQRDVDEANQPERLIYGTTPDRAVTELGRVCLKAQAGIQTVYDPHRIQHPLKRVGPRNSGQWQTITWNQAFTEIAARINQLIPPAERDQLIDPAVPQLGRKRNQLVYSPGRSVEKELSDRIWKNGWGTVNSAIDHTSICEATRHVAGELVTWNPAGTQNSLGGGRTVGWQADVLGAEFIMYFGASPLEADFPMVGMARNVMQFKLNGGQFVVVDPRLSNSAAKATGVPARGIPGWIPITPGGDGALALGMMSWILENSRHNVVYLTNPNQAAATADGEPTWTDSTYLVGTFTDGAQTFQRYVTEQDLNPASTSNDYLVWSNGAAIGNTKVAHGELEPPGTATVTIGGQAVPVKSAFTLLKESVNSRTRAQYSALCGVSVATMEALAGEFVSHGRKASAQSYRGAVKHTNGMYNQLAIQHLNTLIGNYDWKGGCTVGGGGFSNASGVVSLGKVTGDPGHDGIRIDRAMAFYEQSGMFAGYPARRPWFPFATKGNYQELIPSIQDGYPYPVKVLITYWNALPYSVPGLRQTWEQTMGDESKLPLFVAISPVMGEVPAWADYVLPDSTYLEKFAVPGIPWRVNKGTSFQQPVVGAYDGRPIGVRPANGGVGNAIPAGGVNNYTPFLPDTKAVADIHIGLAKALGLPGVGDNALLDASGNVVGNLNNAWDWAKAMLANIAASAAAKYPGITVDEILSKGGVFDNPGEEYQGELLAYRYGNIIRTFADPVARTRDSVTGQFYSGVAQYKDQAHADGTAVSDAGLPLKLITYKMVQHGQARTNVNPWLMLMQPENYVELSATDAAARAVVSGDRVRVTSASNTVGIVGRAKVTQGLRPGVVGISHHFGHWEQGVRPHVIDGAASGFDPSRGAGIHPGTVMRRDRRYANGPLQEAIGGSCSFYDTWVQVIKV